MPKSPRAALAKAGIDHRLLDLFALNMEPTGEKSEAELRALVFTRGGARVHSVKFRNWIVNWREVVFGAVPAFAEAIMRALTTGEVIFAVLSALEGFRALVEAATIELAPEHGQVVKILWLDHPNSTEVSITSLVVAMGIPEMRLQELLDDLLALGIIEIKAGDQVVKRDRIVLSAM